MDHLDPRSPGSGGLGPHPEIRIILGHAEVQLADVVRIGRRDHLDIVPGLSGHAVGRCIHIIDASAGKRIEVGACTKPGGITQDIAGNIQLGAQPCRTDTHITIVINTGIAQCGATRPLRNIVCGTEPVIFPDGQLDWQLPAMQSCAPFTLPFTSSLYPGIAVPTPKFP